MTREHQIKMMPNILAEFGEDIAREWLLLKPEECDSYLRGFSSACKWNQDMMRSVKS